VNGEKRHDFRAFLGGEKMPYLDPQPPPLHRGNKREDYYMMFLGVYLRYEKQMKSREKQRSR